MAELKMVDRYNGGSDTRGSNRPLYSISEQTDDPSHIKWGVKNSGYTPDEIELQQRQIDTSNSHLSEQELEVVTKDYNEEVITITGIAVYIDHLQTVLHAFYQDWKTSIWIMIYILLGMAYFAYFGYAMYYEFGDEGSIRLMVVTILASIFVVYQLLINICKLPIVLICERESADKVGVWIHRISVIILSLFMVIYIIVAIAIKSPRNLISAAGIVFYILVFYIFSKYPARVNWRPVFWGLTMQFIFALIILRWNVGYDIFQWLGSRVHEFLAHADRGSEFLFGKNTYEHHFFAFKVLPVIIFFSSIVSILYYLGVMQLIIRNLARFMAWIMQTSPAESLNAAGNIFIGQSEAPLLIRPFIKEMTNSELHAVLTGGFATIAGSVMAAYILMGRNIIEAASNGASMSIKLVANIAVNLIAFIAILGFVNATLAWMGHRVGLFNPELSFELICSYIFWPLSFLMGVDTDDCRKVAKLIGIKTFINEFVAYSVLGVYIDNTVNFTRYITNETGLLTTGQWSWVNDGDIHLHDLNATLLGGIISDRSKVITTYALCGFSNIGSIGVMLGALGAMAPSRKADLTKIVVRAMIAGNVACFMTACIAGLLYEGVQ
ncbi:hypothetical protein ACJMK2_023480 [Sinanodonta woodiana]|uniref:Sodium/nucleoside cotransporter n=1 Tax=Sinanodonta woodiana TaxID=1069815 RepID=A0ABD3T545_SINWO